MKINPLNNPHRRHRGNRSGGRNRNRQNQNHNRNRNDRRGRGRSYTRNRGGSRRKAPPPPTKWQTFLSSITFGRLGRPAGKPKRAAGGKPRAERKPGGKPAPEHGSESKPAASKSAGASEKKRKSRRTEVTSGRLYVGNLEYSANEEQLDELFRGAGNVVKSEVVTNPRTQQSKGFAFVEMGSIDEAKRAVSILDDQDFMGRRLIVTGARSDGRRDSESSGDSDGQEEEAKSGAASSESSAKSRS